MNGTERRDEILKALEKATSPVSASVLAKNFSVSRQIIVQDIALLRSAGKNIVAHSKGYVLDKGSISRVFKVIHSDEDVETELNLIVDHGGTVEDVFIYHKYYGTLRAPMNIRSRLQVKSFLKDIASGKSSLLKNVTSGYHYHTVSAENANTLDLIEDTLWSHGFLAKLQEFEPVDFSNQ